MNPFVGLRPFRTGEGDLFFGRDRDTAVLTNLVLATPVLVLYATSGTGKSSLLNAGLVPKLDEDPSLLTLVIAEPHADVNAMVRTRLSETGWNSSDIDGCDGFANILERHFETTNRRVVLVLDQFEERIKRSTTLDELYDDIARLANTRSEAATVVLSIREDYVMSLEPLLRRVVGLLDASYRVPSLTHAELEQAVTGPLAAVGGGVSPEPSLIDEVLGDLEHEARSGKRTSGRIEAGFFQIVWHYLWEQDATNPGSHLTLHTYEDAGRATGILRSYASGILSALHPHEAEVLRAAIRYLVLPTGAKVPLTVDDLVGLIREQDFTATAEDLFSLGNQTIIRLLLNSVLDRLTRSGAALLRRVVRDDREEFELVHDLVGTIMLDWRERYPDELAEASRNLVTEVFGDLRDSRRQVIPRHRAAGVVKEVRRSLADCRRRLESAIIDTGKIEEIGEEIRKALVECRRLDLGRWGERSKRRSKLETDLDRTRDVFRNAAIEASSPVRDTLLREVWAYSVLRPAIDVEDRFGDSRIRRHGFRLNTLSLRAWTLGVSFVLMTATMVGAVRLTDVFLPVPELGNPTINSNLAASIRLFYAAGSAAMYALAVGDNHFCVTFRVALLRTLIPFSGRPDLPPIVFLPLWWPFHFFFFNVVSVGGAWLFQAIGWSPAMGLHLAAAIMVIVNFLGYRYAEKL